MLLFIKFFIVKPTALSAIGGQFPNKVHMHVRRYPISEMPKTDAELSQWCYDLFTKKDELLEYFEKHNEFPKLENSNKEQG